MTMHKLGTLTPVVYFVNHRDPRHAEGHILIAPYTGFPAPEGYSTEYADTLAAVDKLQKRLQEQTRREFAAEQRALYGDGAVRDAIHERLLARLVSSETSEHDKDFIRAWLKVREDKRDYFARQFECRNSYLYAREMDLGSRHADSEEFNVEKHTVPD